MNDTVKAKRKKIFRLVKKIEKGNIRIVLLGGDVNAKILHQFVGLEFDPEVFEICLEIEVQG